MKEELTYEKRISYTQVLEVLNNMEKENVDKIPIKLIEFFENNSDTLNVPKVAHNVNIGHDKI